MAVEQTEIKRRIRKFKNLLSTAGYGVIVFIVWGIVKQIIYSLHFIPNGEQSYKESYSIVSAIFCGVLLAVCLTTGILANKNGKKDKKESTLLIVFSIILLAFTVLNVAIDVSLIFTILNQLNTIIIIAIITDFLFSVFVVQIVVSIFKLRHYYKLVEEAKNER